MPPQKGAKIGGFLDNFDSHKNDETVAPKGGGDLPAGINAGIAELVEIKGGVHEAGKKNAGQPFIYLAGIVRETEPEFKHCIGMRTSKIIGLYPSGKKTKDDKEKEFLNELRLLGLETKGMKKQDIDGAIEVLLQSRVMFKFQTWKGQATAQYPNPMTNHKWLGSAGLQNYTPADPSSNQVVDNTIDASGDSGEVDERAHFMELGERADGGDGEAETELIEALKSHDINYVKIPSWVEAAEALNAKLASGTSGATEEPKTEDAGPWKPKEGDVYVVRKPGGRKDVEIEVVQVFSKTMKAKQLDNDEILNSIPWTSDPKTIYGKPF